MICLFALTIAFPSQLECDDELKLGDKVMQAVFEVTRGKGFEPYICACSLCLD